MPWLAVEKKYEFDGPKGKASLLDLFDGRRQLIVYRAFFEPGVFGWPDHACRGCSMVADQVAHVSHLNARDTTLVFASRASQADIARLKANKDIKVVETVKEGQALSITQQRNADNLKSIASMDALVDLPNMNATELAIRLPGVTFGDPGDEVVESISVRGMGSGMTSITIDGGGMSSFSAQNRNTRMTAFTGAMFAWATWQYGPGWLLASRLLLGCALVVLFFIGYSAWLSAHAMQTEA